jgi:hypothetical protein
VWVLGAALVACGPLAETEDTGHTTAAGTSTPPSLLGPRYGIQPQFCAEPVIEMTKGDLWSVRGDRYQLFVSPSWSLAESQGFGRLVETAWPAFEHFFGAPASGPDGGPLEGYLFDTEEAWSQAIADDGLSVPWGSGGLFHPSTGRMYLWQQPEACVRLGVVPTGTLEDAHGVALSNWYAGALDPGQMVADPTYLSRPNAMAWFAYLEEEHGPAFHAYREGVDGGGIDEEGLFIELLGEPGSHAAAFQAWLERHQEPILVEFTGWRHVDQTHIEAAQPLGSPFEAGTLVSFEDDNNWTVLLANGAGDVTALQVDATGGWWWSVGAIEPPSRDMTFTFPITDDVTDLTVNGQVQTYDHGQLGAAGLAVYDARVLFEFDLD